MEREPGRPFECVVVAGGDLRPTDPGRARALGERQGEVLVVREMTPAQIRSERQSRYWFVAIVRTVRDIWIRRGLIPTLTPKEAVHDALMTCFGGGLVPTPLGPARTSSTTKTVKEFLAITEEVRGWVRHEYGVPIPSGEDWLRDHAREDGAA